MDTDDIKKASEEAAKIIDSPLFAQIAAMMVACTAAKMLVDKTVKYNAEGNALKSEEITDLNDTLLNLANQLAGIDFEHGQQIVAGAMDACRLAQPGVDIICSGFLVGMPQKSKNPKKTLFIKGGIAANKGAVIYVDKAGAETLIQRVTECLDILYPQRLVGMGAKPNLIINAGG